MPTTVEIPGLGDVDFPDSMSRQEISVAAKRLYEKHNPKPTELKSSTSTDPLSAVATSSSKEDIVPSRGVPSAWSEAFSPAGASKERSRIFREEYDKAVKAGDVDSEYAVSRLLPFIGAAPRIGRLLATDEAVKRMTKANAGEQPYSEQDIIAQKPEQDIALAARLAAEPEIEKSKGVVRKIADIAGQAPKFMVEFAGTAGGFTLAKGTTEAFLRQALGRYAAKTAGAMAGVTAQTALNPQMVSEMYANQLSKNYELTPGDDGKIAGIIAKEDDFAPSFKNAFVGSMAELGTERVGWLLEKPMGWLKAATINRWLKKGGKLSALDKTLKKGGWNGVIGEEFEELVNDLAGPTYGEDLPNYSDPEYWKQQGIQTAAFGVIGGAAGALNTASRVSAYKNIKQQRQQRDETNKSNKIRNDYSKVIRTLEDELYESRAQENAPGMAGVPETTREASPSVTPTPLPVAGGEAAPAVGVVPPVAKPAQQFPAETAAGSTGAQATSAGTAPVASAAEPAIAPRVERITPAGESPVVKDTGADSLTKTPAANPAREVATVPTLDEQALLREELAALQPDETQKGGENNGEKVQGQEGQVVPPATTESAPSPSPSVPAATESSTAPEYSPASALKIKLDGIVNMVFGEDDGEGNVAYITGTRQQTDSIKKKGRVARGSLPSVILDPAQAEETLFRGTTADAGKTASSTRLVFMQNGDRIILTSAWKSQAKRQDKKSKKARSRVKTPYATEEARVPRVRIDGKTVSFKDAKEDGWKVLASIKSLAPQKHYESEFSASEWPTIRFALDERMAALRRNVQVGVDWLQAQDDFAQTEGTVDLRATGAANNTEAEVQALFEGAVSDLLAEQRTAWQQRNRDLITSGNPTVKQFAPRPFTSHELTRAASLILGDKENNPALVDFLLESQQDYLKSEVARAREGHKITKESIDIALIEAIKRQLIYAHENIKSRQRIAEKNEQTNRQRSKVRAGEEGSAGANRQQVQQAVEEAKPVTNSILPPEGQRPGWMTIERVKSLLYRKVKEVREIEKQRQVGSDLESLRTKRDELGDILNALYTEAEETIPPNSSLTFYNRIPQAPSAEAAKERLLNKAPSTSVWDTPEGVSILKAVEEAAPGKVDAIVSALESAKVDMRGQMHAFGIIPAVWNSAIDIAILSVKAGAHVADAVSKALTYIKSQQPTGWDEKAAEDALNKAMLNPVENQITADSEVIAQEGSGVVAKFRAMRQVFADYVNLNKNTKEAENRLRGLRSNAIYEAREAALRSGTVPDIVPDVSSKNFVDEVERLITAGGKTFDRAAADSDWSRVRAFRIARAIVSRVKKIAHLDELLSFYDPASKEHADGLKVLTERRAETEKELAKLRAKNPGASNIADSLQKLDIENLDNQAAKRALNRSDVKSEFTNPLDALAELNALNVQMRDAANITDENERRAVLRSINDRLERFDRAHANLVAELAEKEAEFKKLADENNEAYANANRDKAAAENTLAHAMAVLKGGQDLAGTLSRAEQEALAGYWSAVDHFARMLATELDKAGQYSDAGRLMDWIKDPAANPLPAGITPPGISTEAFNLLRKAVENSEPYQNAVIALVDARRQGMEAMPMNRLKELEDAVTRGASDVELANLHDALESVENDGMTAADLARKRAVSTLRQATINIRSVRMAKELFETVRNSPAFNQLRSELENRFQQTVMLNDQGGTLVGFKFPGKEDVAAVTFNPSGMMSKEKRNKVFSSIAQWFANAEEYRNAYEYHQQLYENGILPNPPQFYGYDNALYNGLREAIELHQPVIAAVDAFSGLGLKPNAFILALNKLGWFQQIMAVAENTPGFFGRVFMNKVGVIFHNMMPRLAEVGTRPQFRELPSLRTKAMKSHPELHGDQQAYQEKVINHIGTKGRQFNSQLKAGVRLDNGYEVTKADMEYLLRKLSYESELEKIAESRKEYGVREEKGGKIYRRARVPLGDYTLSRILGHRGYTVSEEIRQAHQQAGVAAINPADDLSENSTHPLVKLWNKLGKRGFLAWHVLDSTRSDREMRIDPEMHKLEAALAERMRRNGHSQMDRKDGYNLSGMVKADTLQDIVDELAGLYTGTANAREFVVNHIVAELNQYVRNAEQQFSEHEAEARQAEMVQGLTAMNEFHTPAANLRFPSNLYDYGAVTDNAVFAQKMRVVQEAMVEMVNAMDLANDTAQKQIDEAVKLRDEAKLLRKSGRESEAVKKEAQANELLAAFGGDAALAESLVFVLRELKNKLSTEPTREGDAAQLALSASRNLIAQWLSGVSVAVGNVVGATHAMFNSFVQIHNTHRIISVLLGMKELTKATIRMVPTLAGATARFAGRSVLKIPKVARQVEYLRTKHPALYKATASLASNIVKGISLNTLQRVDEVRRLGFGEDVNPFLRTMFDSLNSLKEYQNTEEAQRMQRGGPVRKAWEGAWKLARTGLRIAEAGTGALPTSVGHVDFGINADLLMDSVKNTIIPELEETANRWIKNRAGRTDAYNPLDATWTVKPGEFSRRLMAEDRATNLENMRQFLAAAAVPSMETVFLRFRKAKKTNPKAKLFTPEETDNLTRTWLAKTNKATPANRALAAKKSPTAAGTYSLFGYVSSQSLELAKSYRSLPNSEMRKYLLMAAGTTFMVMIAAAAFGLYGLAGREEAARALLGKYGNVLSPLDASFWNKGLGQATANTALGSLSIFPYVGTMALNMIGEAQGRKGYDPSLPIISMALDSVSLLRGLAASPVEDWNVPFRKYMQRNFPYVNIALRLTGNAEMIDAQSAANVYTKHARAEGILQERMTQSTGTFRPGPTYGMVDKMRNAIIGGDMTEAMKQRDRIVEFITDQNVNRGMDAASARKEAYRQAYRDYESMNPAFVGNNRKVPTEQEYNTVVNAMTTGEREQFDRVMEAWKTGAQMFAGQEGVSSRAENPLPYRAERASVPVAGPSYGYASSSRIQSPAPLRGGYGRMPGISAVGGLGGYRPSRSTGGSRIRIQFASMPLRRGYTTARSRISGLKPVRRVSVRGIRRVSPSRVKPRPMKRSRVLRA